ncbi:hypothetical protein CCZ01_09650 [Helicobacter monodelphidis]|uniref:hypothetical protein n=1 Tax=Helicobacter sp. 15-1451 TaxID=2004995 RepID=UPI000DCBFB1B|nr:hypothetical protein [Helicobacter sp. 15-1451]RAX56392.1 hypothetical protein CCZ01_09650 [Helicobacter sp. 15-1451]
MSVYGFEIFRGKITEVGMSKVGVTSGSMNSSGRGHVSTRVERHAHFKLDGKAFEHINSGLLEEGDEVAIAAKNMKNGFYRVEILRNFTKGYYQDSKLSEFIGLFLMIILSPIFHLFITYWLFGTVFGESIGALLAFIAMIATIVFLFYVGIRYNRIAKTIKNM